MGWSLHSVPIQKAVEQGLAERIGAKVTGSFSHYPAKGEFLKLVTFVPEGDVEKGGSLASSALRGYAATVALTGSLHGPARPLLLSQRSM